MRIGVCALACFGMLALAAAATAENPKVKKYCRFEAGKTVAYGIVEGDTITELDGDLFGEWKKTDRTHKLGSVKLLAPCKPRTVLALAGNYKSHLNIQNTVSNIVTTTKLTTTKDGETTSESKTVVDTTKAGEIPARYQLVQPFLKPASCIIGTGENIVIPPGTNDVHYEAEMVIVIGKRAKNVSESNALEYVFGVAPGNDVSARDWQKADIQWWRAKGSDTFGPMGPFIISGVDYDNLRLQLRVNGETKQDCNTKEFINNTAKMVSFISKCVTLEPGDVIFTGTSGITQAIKPGDVVEVELEGAGILKNPVVAGK